MNADKEKTIVDDEAGLAPVINVYRIVIQIGVLAATGFCLVVVGQFLFGLAGGEGAGVALVVTHAIVLVLAFLNTVISIPSRYGNPFLQRGIVGLFAWSSWAAIGLYFVASVILMVRNH